MGTGVLQKIVDADADRLEQAVKLIRKVDYKTVSIVEFEQSLLGLRSENQLPNDEQRRALGRSG